MGSQELAERILDQLFPLNATSLFGIVSIVVDEADICGVGFFSLKSCKLVIAERAGHLSRTVRAEVEEDHGIVVLDGSDGISILRLSATAGTTNSSVFPSS